MSNPDSFISPIIISDISFLNKQVSIGHNCLILDRLSSSSRIVDSLSSLIDSFIATCPSVCVCARVYYSFILILSPPTHIIVTYEGLNVKASSKYASRPSYVATLVTSNGKISGTVDIKIFKTSFANVSETGVTVHVKDGVDITAGHIYSGERRRLYYLSSIPMMTAQSVLLCNIRILAPFHFL